MKNTNKFIIVVVMMCSICLLIEIIKKEEPIATNHWRKDKPACPKGVITVINGGRLCNKIFEYVSVWAISKSYGLVPYVPNVIHSVLRRLFTHLSIPPISKLVNSSGNCSNINHKIFNKLNNDVTHLKVTARKTGGSEHTFILKKYIVLVDAIVPLVGELKKEFKYQPVYIHKAQDRLQHARAIMNDEHGNREQPLFVAVHVRRTDYTGYLRSGGVTMTADINYYRHAVAWMLRKLTSDTTSSHNIAFILASDDQVWCETKLLPEIQEEIQSFGNETNLGGCSVFYLGEKETPVVDLVMLSSCNHSIISYGTYGLWSALMVNGWTVVYDMLAKNNPDSVEQINHSPMLFAKKLEKWVALS